MKFRASLPLLAATILLSSCAKVPEKAPQPNPEKGPAFNEITSDTVSFVRMHPGAPQKNAYATWKHYQNQEDNSLVWRIQKEDISEQALASLEGLFAAAEKDLIPSDKLYACRYRENMPQYRLNFHHNDKNFAIVSSSGCQAGVPWNVIIDGKSYVQISGEIGKALEELLSNSGQPIAIGDTAGMFMFTEPVEIEEYKASGDKTPAAWFDGEFRKDPAFGDTLQNIEKLFGPLELPEIACNQSKSSNCQNISAKYTLKFGLDYEYNIPIKFEAGTVTAIIPPKTAFENLANAAKTSVFKAWSKSAPREEPVKLAYDNPEECKMVHGLAKHFELPEDISCESWKLTSKDFPSAILYSGLQAIWIEPDKNYKTYFDAVRQLQTDNKEKKVNYGQFAAPDKSTNLFVRLDGRPIAFVTKDGKTTINQP